MRVLFLDDEKWRVTLYKEMFSEHSLEWVTDPIIFFERARKSFYDILSLDHDLHLAGSQRIPGTGLFSPSSNNLTGQDAVRGLCEDMGESEGAFIIIHSWNRIGSEMMLKEFRKVGLEVPHKKFGSNSYFEKIRDVKPSPQTSVLKRLLSRVLS